MNSKSILLLVILVLASYPLAKLCSFLWATFIGRKYLKQINEQYDELVFLYKHNCGMANLTLAEWHDDPESSAREIWTEVELLEQLKQAEDELNHEKYLHETFLKCLTNCSASRDRDKKIDVLLTYYQYLTYLSEYRQNIDISDTAYNDINTKITQYGEREEYCSVKEIFAERLASIATQSTAA
jgi:hypothetical protein